MRVGTRCHTAEQANMKDYDAWARMLLAFVGCQADVTHSSQHKKSHIFLRQKVYSFGLEHEIPNQIEENCIFIYLLNE